MSEVFRCARFVQSIHGPVLICCGSFLLNLISNDVSNLVQNQSIAIIRFVPYMATFAMIVVFLFVKRTVEYYLPQDTVPPDPDRDTGHPDRADVDNDDQFLSDYIGLHRRCLVENDPNLTFLIRYLRRLLMEDGDDLKHVVNYLRKLSIERGSYKSCESAPASVSLAAIERSSQSQLGISNCGAGESSSRTPPGSPECLQGLEGKSSSLAQGPVLSSDLVLTIGTREPEMEEVYIPKEITEEIFQDLKEDTSNIEYSSISMEFEDAVQNASWTDLEPQSALEDSSEETVLTEASKRANQFFYGEVETPRFLLAPERQTIRDTNPITPTRPEPPSADKNKGSRVLNTKSGDER